ncbi:hypothetical protein ACFFHJ_16850 [Planotetraspora thailandica]|nr:hypothetical protein [Planotetraspora thailandica]
MDITEANHVPDAPEELPEDPDDLVEGAEDDDEELEPKDTYDFDGLVHAYNVRWNREFPWPAVQTLNRRRARLFLLIASLHAGNWHAETLYDRLGGRQHGLAFYTRLDDGQRAFMCRQYGRPKPHALAAVPPEVFEEGQGEPWQLIATYHGPELFEENWNEQVSALPLDSFLTIHVAGAGECALRVRDEKLKLIKIGEDGTQTVTALGRLGAGDDPLALAVRAVPDLFTFDPHAAVDITTDAPFAVADAIRFSADVDRDLAGWLNEDFFTDEEQNLLGPLDSNLVPVMFRINGVPHFAAQVDDDWALVPVERRYRVPSPVTNRTFISVSYDYDGGGYSSGRGFEAIAEIRPGLNIAWEDYSDEAWDREMTLSRTPLPEFAASHLPYRFRDRILAAVRGEEDRFAGHAWGEDPEIATNLGDDEKWYDVNTPEINFDLHDAEGVRFLAALGRPHPDGHDESPPTPTEPNSCG